MSDKIALRRLRARDRRGLPDLVRDAVIEVIAERRLKAGDRLPPEPVLADMLAVSRPTLREAIRTLQMEGALVRTRGRGTFVAGTPFLQNNLNVNFGVTDLIRSKGRTAGTVDMQIRVEAPEAPVRSALALEPEAKVVTIERVRTADGQRVVFSADVVPAALVLPGATVPPTFGESLYAWLQTRCGIAIHHGVARIKPIVATAVLAARLAVRRGSPLLTLEQVDFTADGRPVLYSLEYHVPDAFEITVYRTGREGAR